MHIFKSTSQDSHTRRKGNHRDYQQYWIYNSKECSVKPVWKYDYPNKEDHTQWVPWIENLSIWILTFIFHLMIILLPKGWTNISRLTPVRTYILKLWEKLKRIRREQKIQIYLWYERLREFFLRSHLFYGPIINERANNLL